MTERRRSIGIFDDSLKTEAGLKELDNSHYSLDRVFVIASDRERETDIVGTELCESLRSRFRNKISSIAQQDSNIVGGETVISLTKALTQLDIPMEEARYYSDLVAKGKYLVMVEGNQDNISGAKTILNVVVSKIG